MLCCGIGFGIRRRLRIICARVRADSAAEADAAAATAARAAPARCARRAAARERPPWRPAAAVLGRASRRSIVTTSPPETFSVAPSCDELTRTVNSNSASSACKISERTVLAVNRSGYRRSSGSRRKLTTGLIVRLSVRRSLPPPERKAPFVEPILQKRTKIVATVGPASREPRDPALALRFRRERPALKLLSRNAGEHAEVIRDRPRDLRRTQHPNGHPSRSSRPEGAHRQTRRRRRLRCRSRAASRSSLTIDDVAGTKPNA